MDASSHQRLREVFLRACERHGADRASYLDEACADDSALREAVETLLLHDEDPITAVRAVSRGSGAMHLARGLAAADAEEAESDLPRPAGRYTLLRVIGRGGMGVVYEARQVGTNRRVALKAIRPGLLTREHMRRFRLEMQVLGRLRHPGIAQIYEAGAADEGEGEQPYFAMELVTGRPLCEYAEAESLRTPERLELVALICDALHHAHQRGVIHRDLKPANVLIDESGEDEERDARRLQPKILDFGVARSTDADTQTVTMRTDLGQLVGTVPYMSPEQAAGDPKDIDLRSDVYSAGVLMFELLGGRLPYDLSDKMIHEAVRVIREQEPTRLSSIDKALRGDVDTIVAKALAKEKDRRYQTAGEMASDIRRYLEQRPIVARRTSTAYRLRKFARRNRAATGVAGVALAALCIATIASSWQVHGARIADLFRPVKEFNRDVVLWAEAAPGFEACAFDEFFPGIAGDRGCLSPSPAAIRLTGGTVTLTAFDAGGAVACPIYDDAKILAVSDGSLSEGGMFVLGFEPPVTAFYTFFGSLGYGATVTMSLHDADALVDSLVSLPSADATFASGFGFVSRVPIHRVELTATASSGSAVGAFIGLTEDERSLGSVEIPGYAGPNGTTVALDFACVFSDRASPIDVHDASPTAR